MRHLLPVLLLLLAVPSAAQDATVPVPATVKLDGVPAIPASIAEKFAPYGEYRSAELLSWHPTRRQMLIATTFGNRRQIHLVDGPGRARTQLTFGPGVVGAASFEPTRGEYFVFRRDTGPERTQLFRFDLATRAVTMLTDGASRNAVTSVWAKKSGLLAFDSTRRTGTAREVWVMDPMKPASARLVFEATGNWIVQDWSPDERELLVEERASSDARHMWRVDVKTGTKTVLTPKEPAYWELARFSADGRSVYAMSSRGSEFTRLWRADVATGTWTALTPEGQSVEWYAVSPDGRTIAVVFDRDAESVLELLDAATLKPRQKPAVLTGTLRRPQWRTADELGFELNSVQTAYDVYSVSAKSGAVERWTTSESGGANPDELPAPEIVRWKSFDGLTITGVLYRPPSRFTGPRPVVINIHGGPDDARERPRFLGRSGSLLTELGVAIVYPNYRGSPGFGRAFMAADNGRLREDAVKDIGALLDWIAQQPHLDKNRVMVLGASYGGYMAYAVAEKYGDRIKAAAAYAAISNFVSYLETTDPVRLTNRRSEYGDERDPATREFLMQISPVTHAAKIRVPLYVGHGAKDIRVPLAQAQEMVRAVRANGVPVWFAVFEDEGHGLGNPVNNDLNLFIWARFMQEYLLK